MLFTSLQYAVFLPIVVVLFWLLPRKSRLPMLLLASYLFYMSWMPIFILLIVPLTLFNWLYGKLLARETSARKLVFGVGIAINLIVLGIFKYAGFFAQTFAAAAHLTAGVNWSFNVNIILPLGISFFTFEFIHYLFEIYKGNKPVDSFVLFALYAAFFPTQIAGPIKRYPDFVKQMCAQPPLRLSYFDEGVPLIVVGLAKKLLLADTLAVFVNMGFTEPTAYGALELWLFAIAFAFQIYFDFSGYTDIGRGSAMLFGYHIPINFNMPYIARNISDFWHRWHISLSTWLRDYLFIPLGGSRNGEGNTNRNLMFTMTLGGLWHGASFNFIIWGVYHGLLLVAHRWFSRWKTAWQPLESAVDSALGRGLSTVLTFAAVCIGWVFFRVQDLALAVPIVRKMVTLHPLLIKAEAGHMLVLDERLPIVVPIALAMVAALVISNLPLSALNERGVFRTAHPVLKSAFCAAALLLIIALSPDNTQPFIYFQF